MFAPLFDLASGEFLLQTVCASAFLVGVAKSAHPVELSLAYKFAQFFELFLGFASEPDNERRSQSDLRNRTTHLLNRTKENVRAATTFHALQHRGRSMLQRHINVRTNLFVLGDGFEQTVA